MYLSLQDFDLCVQCYEKDGHPHKMEKLGLDLDDGSSPSDQKQDNPQARTFQSLLMYYILISYHELNAYIECKQLAVHRTFYVPLASSSASNTVTYSKLNCYKENLKSGSSNEYDMSLEVWREEWDRTDEEMESL